MVIICGIKYKITTLHPFIIAVYEGCKNTFSTNFAQSQWLIVDLYAQEVDVRSDPQKGGQHLHLILDHHMQ